MDAFPIKDDDDDLDDDVDDRHFEVMLQKHNDTFENDDDDDDDDGGGGASGGYQDVNDQDNFTNEDDRFANSENQDSDHNWTSDQTNCHGKFTSTPHQVDQTPPSFRSSFPQTPFDHRFDDLQHHHEDEETLDMFINNNNNNVQQQLHFEAEGNEDDYDDGINNDPTAFVRDKCQYPSTYNDNFDNVAGTVLSDKNQKFFGEVGSRGDGQLQQMKILRERMNENYFKSEEAIKQLNEELVSKERVIKHMEKQIKEYVNENKHQVKQNHDLDIKFNDLLREKENLIENEEKLHAYVREKEMLIESLDNENENLRSADLLKSTKQQYESLVAQLEEKHRKELLPLKEDLQKCRARIVEQEQTIKNIRSEKDEYVKEFQQKNDTIVRLNQNLHDSQEQISKMSSMKNVNASEVNMLLLQLEELKFNQKKVEDLNKALEEEIGRLNYQLASQQRPDLHNLNKIVSTNGMRGQNDDSYAQLNIKNPNGITDAGMSFMPGNNSENLSNSKTFPADKLLGMFNHIRSQNVELKEQLKKANDEVKKLEGEIRENRNLLMQKSETKIQQLPCDGNCTTSSTLNEELRDLKAKNKSLASLKKNFESESLIKDDHIKQLEAEINKFSEDKIALEEKYNNERRIALEKCNSQWSERLNKMLEASQLDADYELERLKKNNEDNEIKLARVQQDYLECCERIDSLEQELNAEWQAKIKEIEDSHKTQILTMKDFYVLQQNSQVSKTDSKSIQVELNDKSKKELLELNDRVGKLRSSLQISESMKHQLETTLQERNDVINSKEIILQNRMREIERLNDGCLKLERDIKDQEAKVRQKVEEEVDGFLMQCIKQMNIIHGRDFDNKWPWSQKMKYLLLIKRDLDGKKNETSAKESNLMQKVGHLEKKIDSLENESLEYIRLNTELRDQNLELSEQLSEVNSELESLRGCPSKIGSVQRDYEKVKKKLDEYKLENRNLHFDAKKSEAKVQRLEKEVDKMRTRLESTCPENEERLKNELTDAVNKLMESRRIICDLESESKRRLEEMMQSMEREKEDFICQLKKNFQRNVAVMEKEKRILYDQNEMQVKQLKSQLKDLLAEKKALENSDISELLATYKVGVEDMKRFYDTRVKELDRKEKEYVKARHRIMEVTRKSYLHALINYLNERFENSTAIEIMAKVDVHLDRVSPSHIDLETFDQGPKNSLKEPPSHGLQQTSERTYRSASQLSSHQTASHSSKGISSYRLNDYDGR